MTIYSNRGEMITAEHYSATSQCVRDAMRCDGRIECLRRETYDAIRRELDRECEGSSDEREDDGRLCSEYWGADCDGRQWRVSVEVRS